MGSRDPIRALRWRAVYVSTAEGFAAKRRWSRTWDRVVHPLRTAKLDIEDELWHGPLGEIFAELEDIRRAQELAESNLAGVLNLPAFADSPLAGRSAEVLVEADTDRGWVPAQIRPTTAPSRLEHAAKMSTPIYRSNAMQAVDRATVSSPDGHKRCN